MESELIFKFRFSRRVWLLTALYVGIFTLLAAALYFLYEGGYLSAWFSSCIVALLLLMALSIPRKIRLNDERLCIDCLMDITELPLSEIASVRPVERSEMKGIIPLLGGFGFFGYYGHYLDVIQVERVRIYASEWDNFVEITDIYESRMYISCSERDKLIASIEQAVREKSNEQ
ncbi:MAG: hypothetical protein E7137_01290 [Rikenellaceae bacterium]|nr:hypothetical protein [Rikenellaceae bacterium]